jgi:hypothetical protein
MDGETDGKAQQKAELKLLQRKSDLITQCRHIGTAPIHPYTSTVDGVNNTTMVAKPELSRTSHQSSAKKKIGR